MQVGAHIASACGVLIALTGCSLPRGVDRPPSSALADTSATRLGHALAAAVSAHRGKTGLLALDNSRDAFAARVALARAADRSLDVQYYIWHPDTSGALLARELWQAAQRGVRVRLLLDDNNTRGMDETISALDAHPNIEVRLFNPYANRSWRLVELAADFARVNRRMHNKSFTADNQATIVGGRNVGDEYFGADSPVEFADLDVVAIGAVVPEISASFDAYWNSESAYPASSLIASTNVQIPWSKVDDSPDSARYVDAVRATPLVRMLVAGGVQFEWGHARLVQDDPSKVLTPPERTELHMFPHLVEALGEPARELDLVSPYFVPTREGTAALRTLAERGVRVRVLTNSLAATDVSPVHAGYAKYREALLRAGVRLYELKPSVQEKSRERSAISGSSDASLHAKTFAVDRSRVFVGSFNFDPRSARLNTEMGVVMDSAALAARLSEAFDRDIPEFAYEVRLAGNKLEWIERTKAGEAAGEVRHTSEPGAGLLKRLWIDFLSVLPIEWLL